MKEIINIIVIIAAVLGGTAAFNSFHDTVRKAALEKSAKGLPSLADISASFQRLPKTKVRHPQVKRKSHQDSFDK